MSRQFIPETSHLATRTYWDVFGAEAESKPIEQKLIDMGLCVQNGGHIPDVVNMYVEDRGDESQLDAVQWAIFHYLEYMVNAREPLAPYRYAPTALRIMRLEKDELLELLEKELQRCIVLEDGQYVISGVSAPNDKNLDAIERRHWREHPEESFNHYWDKTRRWDLRFPGMWRKG